MVLWQDGVSMPGFPAEFHFAPAIIPLLMNWYKAALEVSTREKGLQDITSIVRTQLRGWGVREGKCYLFLPNVLQSSRL